MARAIAAVMTACLLGMGSVAVSGVSATAAPATPDPQPSDAQVSIAEPSPKPDNRRLHWSHRNDAAVDGDIRLGTDFFVGAGGVGADPAFTPSSAGGFAHANASASASASAHARARSGHR